VIKEGTMKVLYVTSGDDFAALRFEEKYGTKEYQGLWDKCQSKDDDTIIVEEFIEITAMEFGEVDPEFLAFMWNNMIDYDYAKSTNFYIIDEEE
jgi:hypothetical protein